MRIVSVHNFYRQPGGEDQLFFAERDLLRSRGHEVTEFTLHNDSIAMRDPVSLGLETTWSRDSYRRLRELFRKARPDVAHFHNTFPLVSPAAYYAARAESVPVVQSLQNFRLLCAGATLFRDGRGCEICLRRTIKWPALVHGCYRGSRLASASVVAMQTAHGWLGTWKRMVDVFVAPAQTVRAKAIEGGLPASKIEVKPNFCDDNFGAAHGGGGYALFVGRLAPEKGIETLLAAWRLLGRDVSLRIVGDGPLAEMVETAAGHGLSIDWLGARRPEEVRALMSQAECVIVPSVWSEPFGIVVAEAMSVGTPVLASRIGALAEIVEDGVSGAHFRPGDAADLARCVRQLFSSPKELVKLRTGARAAYERHMSPDANYLKLVEIYSRVTRRPTWAGMAADAATEGFQQ